ncbi:MAG TPA: hypothetical protein EYP59_20810 [Thiotrichaceae bacterium]|nr:hypothetical protein [Thiotrichaceae bacterium]
MQVLHDHYKDTFTHQRTYLKLRDRLFLYLLIVVTIMLLEIAAPEAAGTAISQLIKNQIGIEETIHFSFITGVIWFLLLGLTLKYYQNLMLIERQYAYIRKLEAELNQIYSNSDVIFTREGKTYLKDYPIFSDWAHFLYRIVFPSFLIAIAIFKCFDEWPGLSNFSLSNFFNTVICFGVLATVALVLVPTVKEYFSGNKDTNAEDTTCQVEE